MSAAVELGTTTTKWETVMIEDGLYLIRYKWFNKMNPKAGSVHHTLAHASGGKFNLFSGAEVLSYFRVDEVMPEDERMNNIVRNGNDGEHYGECG
jgi:hypothetical protein